MVLWFRVLVFMLYDKRKVKQSSKLYPNLHFHNKATKILCP
jgi:hypothetical protein